MEINPFNDDYFMKEALKEAHKAYSIDEVPVGAVIVAKNKIIARSHNLTQRLNDATAHAEMQALTSASNYLGSRYLNDCVLYVTLEPCVMCCGGAYWSQLGKIVYGASDRKSGFPHLKNKITLSKTEIISGILEKDCEKILNDFFQNKR